MADLPDWLRIPDGFKETGDPVDSNPFPLDNRRHQVWEDATRQAEEEWARVNVQWMAALSPDTVFDWYPTLFAARFSVWAKRGVHVVWSDAEVHAYDQWLVNYANATLSMLADFFQRRPPPFSADSILLATRNAIGEQVQYWKAEARRYRSEQETQHRTSLASAAPPEVWRELGREFHRLPDMSADAHFGLLGADAVWSDQFRALARRGGIAFGYPPNDAFKGWLIELSLHLRRTTSSWRHPNRIRPTDLVELASDTYALREADGSLTLEADVWIDHVTEASAGFCLRLETDALTVRLELGRPSHSVGGPGGSNSPATTTETGKSTGAFGRNVDRLRKECGWSLQTLAEKVSVDRTTVLSHVSGKSKPRPKTVKAYADIFSIALDRRVSTVDLESETPNPTETRPKPD